MLKFVKEIIIMLVICLVGLLLFAVIFYEYIPSRKIVAEVSSYEVSSEIEELLEDDIDSEDSEVLAIYEEDNYNVTTSDLNSYQATEDYVAGKSNPFATVADDEEETEEESSSSTSSSTSSSETSSSSSSSTSTSSTSSETTSTTSEYSKSTGTK